MTSSSHISQQRKALMNELSSRLSMPCADLSLLDKATTHKSFSAENAVEDFERMEFFGDAVLKFVVAEYLFKEFPAEDEGGLTEICAVLVSAKTLEAVGRSFELEQYIRVGRGVNVRPSFLAKSMEALLGAYYLDSGFDLVRPFIVEHFCSMASSLAVDSVKENYKAQLQHYSQARGQGAPIYKVLETLGPPHDPTFHVVVVVADKELGEGSGRSKKLAEQDAARNAMLRLQSD